MKKSVLTLAMALVSVVSFAFDVIVDGIYYNIDKSSKIAIVTNSNGTSSAVSYSGDVTIPATFPYEGEDYFVTAIDEYAFSGCRNLSSIVIPNTVTKIGYMAFKECTDLSAIKIPDSVTKIDDYVFQGCYSLKSLTIGDSVESIGSYAFYKCTGLTSVDIPNSVTNLGGGAFEDCTGLVSVSISNSLSMIGGKTFCDCVSLTSVEIPNSVYMIGIDAFSLCTSLTTVTIPNSVKYILDNSFMECTSLQDFYCYAEDLPQISSYAFPNTDISKATLHVPAVSLDTYKTTEPWSGFGKIVPLTDQEMDVKNLTVDGVASSAVFDLQGHRFAQPQKGLNIINGKKILVK